MFVIHRFLYVAMFVCLVEDSYHLPINTNNRKSVKEIQLTAIGQFGLVRKARPSVREHFHTGIDIKRPGKNYDTEPVFPIAHGTVISKRDDGAYAQLILEHEVEGLQFWTVYEHIAGITVKAGQKVTPQKSIARFMNKEELDRYGWQFDHFHFEVLKVAPGKLKRDASKPERLYASYSLICYTQEELDKYFYHPLTFLKNKLTN